MRIYAPPEKEKSQKRREWACSPHGPLLFLEKREIQEGLGRGRGTGEYQARRSHKRKSGRCARAEPRLLGLLSNSGISMEAPAWVFHGLGVGKASSGSK